MRRPPLTPRLSAFGTSVFAEMTALARQHGAVNLGQGYPDFDGPDFVKRAAVEAIQAGHNQYAPMPGLPALQQAVARPPEALLRDRPRPGRARSRSTPAPPRPCARRFAGAPRPRRRGASSSSPSTTPTCPGSRSRRRRRASSRSPRPSSGWTRRRSRRRSGPRTRLLVLNSPGNPSGRVFTREELAAIAAVCVERDLLVVTDEVYEHIVFDGAHVPIATLPGMRERTVTISSAGKTFSLTGWKVGWTCAAPALAAAVRAVHQFVTFAVATPFQHAVAAALAAPDEYYARLRAEYLARRDRLCDGLADVGFAVRPARGHLLRPRRHPAARVRRRTRPSAARWSSAWASPRSRRARSWPGSACATSSASPSARTTRRSTRGSAGCGG